MTRPALDLRLGLGLVSLGRVWGVAQTVPPDDEAAQRLLEAAWTLGIRIFDTAPAYGASEARLGRFLRSRAEAEAASAFVMTKAGEEWDEAKGGSRVNHTRDALRRSIDRSFDRLGRIDVLQVHKGTRDVVGHPDVASALAYARERGVSGFGASVTDMEAGRVAIETGLYGFLQFPFNRANPELADLVALCRRKGVVPVINRPFAMGALVTEGPFEAAAQEAFGFLKREVGSGIVLTGTGKAAHLAENVEAFHRSDP
ncbi:aldo/keto reductase [Microvirga pudoricolor]|uniref:aldo/keto reductase n=1 Tax=Microvirga pudoricolor TaxID=2778729 RepID=UPI00194DB535|nr:aldo/keto reductase [Microvirga pudoricolor]MBM6595838.1 aldo/keto reductase [Microvirga pudoricolor]